MWFDKVSEWLTNFFNQPVPIIGCSVLALIVFVLTVLSKTSIGKKSLNFLKGQIEEINKQSKEYLEIAEKSKEQTIKEIEAIKELYEKAIKEKDEKVAELEQLVIKVSKNLHNKNVKELIDNYENKETTNN